MTQNVEIKARAVDFASQAAIAHAISGGGPEVIQQEDIFYNVPQGRLKLRLLCEGCGELIFYQRSDQQGPKLSEYQIADASDRQQVQDVLRLALADDAARQKQILGSGAASDANDLAEIQAALESALGIRNRVMKTRHLYQSGRTRIHFDQVESLGEFIELEVVLADSDQPAGGEQEAQALIDQLGIRSEDLIEAAYVDLLEAIS